MANCTSCGKKLSWKDMGGKDCIDCARKNEDIEKENAKREKEEARLLKEQEGNELASIILTTEMSVNIEIEERVGVITAECVYGVNIFRDLFAAARDAVGGRAKAQQKILKDARKTVLEELRREAHSLGANAVIAIDLDYSEISGGGKSMLLLVASGTAVKAKI